MNKKTIGILTSGGDCPGLNAAIRAVAKTAMDMYGMKVMAVHNGYKGLYEDNIRELEQSDISGILTLGGTILGTSRDKPFKKERLETDEDIEGRVATIKRNINKHAIECLVVLGGNGSHKTSCLLSEEGINVVGIPKTIDNDLYGTDVTIGFNTAVDIVAEAIDRLYSTAHSHNRVMVIEVMGHKAGWLALYAGIAGGGDVIIIPEIPYDMNKITQHIKEREQEGKPFSIVVVAEGALSVRQASLSKKDLKKTQKDERASSVGYTVAAAISKRINNDVRVSVLGYQQRGGAPSARDRILATQLGTKAIEFVVNKDYGKMLIVKNDNIEALPLKETAGRLRLVPADHPLIQYARCIGTSFGD